MIRTVLTERFDLRYPVLLAPMGTFSGGSLAAAVTAAGGLGLIGVGLHDRAHLERELKAAGDARVGLGYICWQLPAARELLGLGLARRPPLVMFAFGDPAPYVEQVRAAGAAVLWQVHSVAEAKAAAALGVDVIVAQGSDSGGHGQPIRAVLGLVPAVVDAVSPIPVVAAGAIADGRGLAAALMLGAAGVLVGTAFCTATESLGGAKAKHRLIEATGDDTLRTSVYDIVRELPWEKPFDGRAIRNRFIEEWHGREGDLRRAVPGLRASYARAVQEADLEVAPVWAGEGVDLVRAEEPAAAILGRMVRQAEALLRGAGGWVVEG